MPFLNGSTNPRTQRFLRWLRQAHAWVGLVGAAFGLLFGVTGFLMNHRSVLKIEAGQIAERTVSVVVEEPFPTSPKALGEVLATRFSVPPERVKARIQAGRSGRVAGVPMKAAEQWVITFQGHKHFAQATYAPGNRTVEVEQREASFVHALKRLHKNDGGSVGWTLLTNAFAGTMFFLSVSGMLLWTRLDGSRLVATCLVLGGVVVMILMASRGW